MDLYITPGYYQVIGASLIDSNMQFLASNVSDLVTKNLIDHLSEEELMEEYKIRIGKVLVDNIDVKYLMYDVATDREYSTPGCIYLYGSIRVLRKVPNNHILLLQLITPANVHLDIIISPRQFGYGADFTSFGTPIAYQLCEPSPVDPNEIILADCVGNQSVRRMSYRFQDRNEVLT